MLPVIQLSTPYGKSVYIISENGRAIVATADTLAALGVSGAGAANVMACMSTGSGGQNAPNNPRTTYNSIGEALGDRLKGFTPRKGGMTKNKISNSELHEKLREIEPGKWQKVYKDGLIDGKKMSLHYYPGN